MEEKEDEWAPWKLTYPDAGEGTVARDAVAVEVRGDGSATAKWPNGSLAVAIDVDTTTSTALQACQTSGTIPVCEPGQGHLRAYTARVVSQERGGSVVVDFNGSGVGSVTNANGKLLLLVNSDGGGMTCDDSGACVAQWTPSGHRKHSEEVVRPQLVRVCEGVVVEYHPAQKALFLHFRAGGVQTCLWQGDNRVPSLRSMKTSDAVGAAFQAGAENQPKPKPKPTKKQGPTLDSLQSVISSILQ